MVTGWPAERAGRDRNDDFVETGVAIDESETTDVAGEVPFSCTVWE
jgi:hypothetical protein